MNAPMRQRKRRRFISPAEARLAIRGPDVPLPPAQDAPPGEPEWLDDDFTAAVLLVAEEIRNGNDGD